MGASAVGSEGGESGVAGDFQEPGGKGGSGREMIDATGEDEEDGLGNIVGAMWVAELAEGSGVDEVDVCGDEEFERRRGVGGHADIIAGRGG